MTSLNILDALLGQPEYRRSLPFYGSTFRVPLSRLEHIEITEPEDEADLGRFMSAKARFTKALRFGLNPKLNLEIADGSVFTPTLEAGRMEAVALLAAARELGTSSLRCRLFFPVVRSVQIVQQAIDRKPFKWWERVPSLPRESEISKYYRLPPEMRTF